MALNPVAYTEQVFASFLRYQLTAYPFAAPYLHRQMRELLSLDRTRRSPLIAGPFLSLSRPFRQGAAISELDDEGLLHPHLKQRIPEAVKRLYRHQERAIRAVAAGRTTLVSTGTGSGKTECFLYPVVSRCLELRDEGAPPGISAVIVYPMNALAEDQVMRLRGLLAGTRIPFGLYIGKTPERENEVAGARLRPGASRADYEARLVRARKEGSGETVYPPEEVCSREAMRTPGKQPRILLTNVKQLELLLTRQQDRELFDGARLDHLVFDEAHTFTGALGGETACLIRRLRAFCRQDTAGTTCVATSATIVDREHPDAARRFASRFFGVEADAVETVGEDYEETVWEAARSTPGTPSGDAARILDDCVRAVESETGRSDAIAGVYRSLSGQGLTLGGGASAGADATSGDDNDGRDEESGGWPGALYGALSRNELVHALSEELAAPRALRDLPPVLENRIGRAVTEAEILAWLTLGAAARREGRPLLRPVLHAFVRGIDGAVVTFPAGPAGPNAGPEEGRGEARLYLSAEDLSAETAPDSAGNGKGSAAWAAFPVNTCTTCGQHYFTSFLRDFSFSGSKPVGGDAGPGGVHWPRLEEPLGGKRVVLFDRLIGTPEEDDGEAAPHRRAVLLHFCRRCGAAHRDEVSRCSGCGVPGDPVRLFVVRPSKKKPSQERHAGTLTSCLSCGALKRSFYGRPLEPARPVRAVTVADVHVLTQDLVHRADRKRLLVFCDNRQDAAFQAGWMKDHARRFRLRALMAGEFARESVSVGDLVNRLDEALDTDEPLSRALVPEVWGVARLEDAPQSHRRERKKYLRFQVLREVAVSSRQAVGLEPWGRMKIGYRGLGESLPWIQESAHRLRLAPDRLCDGVAAVLDYLRRKRALHDAGEGVFTKYWWEGDREIQQGYLPRSFAGPQATKLRRDPENERERSLVTQWLSSAGGDTTIRQMAVKWGAAPDSLEPLLTGLFEMLREQGLLVPVRLLGVRRRPLPGISGVFQVNADRLQLSPNRGVRRCRQCRRRFVRQQPRDLCPSWRCSGELEWVPEGDEGDNYDLAMLDGDYSMLRPAEHTAMVPHDERERLENLFKGDSDAVNALVCTPTLELGIDIGGLDSVLMRNVPPLPANYWQRVGRAGRRHRMAVDLTYCRPASHDRAYFAEPEKLLAGRIDPPAFNLRNPEMVAKQVHATVIARLHGLARDPAKTEEDREAIRTALAECLPTRVTPYLFDEDEVRTAPFDFGALRAVVEEHRGDLTAEAVRVFRQGWPDEDSEVVTEEALAERVAEFPNRLEEVVRRLARRLHWAMRQIGRLNALRERKGLLQADDESLFRRCDRLVKRLKSTRRPRRQAEGHDDNLTFGVLAAEGFLPGYGLEVGSVVGYAEIPRWSPGARDFTLPRPPAAALREYVPGNLIYANGHRFVARHFRRDPGEEQEERPSYLVDLARQAVKRVAPGEGSLAAGPSLPTIPVSDADLSHGSHISDEEENRFQLGVAIYGHELDQHGGGAAWRWGDQTVHLRRGVRMRLVNVGPAAVADGRLPRGYPVCAVCGQSRSPFSSEADLRKFREDHGERCGREPRNLGFYADVVADALSLPGCPDADTAYSVLEALRLGATGRLDMHREDLQILVIGAVEEDDKTAVLWDPMPGGSGLLDRLRDLFDEIVPAARRLVENCPARCDSSCIDCLQSFRNAYYHRHLNRKTALSCFDEWGTALRHDHDLPPRVPTVTPGADAVPVNWAETRLRHLLDAAGFPEGVRNEQIRLDFGLGTTTPDVIYRDALHQPDARVENPNSHDFAGYLARETGSGVCIYLDGMSRHLHGNPETAEKDRRIRDTLRTMDYEVIEIQATQLSDPGAMRNHFRRLARYLERTDLRKRVETDTSWFPKE